MTRRSALLLFCLSCAPGCAGDDTPDLPPGMLDAGDCPSDLPDDSMCGSAAPSYAEQTASIIEQRCTACHFDGNAQSTYVFETYDDVFEARRIMLTRIYSCRMPPEAAPPLSSAERRALLQWFVCGAPEN